MSILPLSRTSGRSIGTLPQAAGSSSTATVQATENSPAVSQSAIVSLQAEKVPVQTYSVPRTPQSSSPIWQKQSNDAASLLMKGNFLSHSLANRFKDLGSTLLDMVKDGIGNFSQSITQSSDVNAVTDTQTNSYPWADEQLTVRTKSGVEVRISLKNQGDNLAVSIKTSGELSEAERIALGNLSDAFQKAIDGLNAAPPRIDLGALTQFDTTVLSSVDFHADITLDQKAPQVLDFHADGTQRTFSLDGPSGKLNVDVDMGNSAIWGNEKQRSASMANYLQQFDSAVSRGHGDKALMTMFKDAFTQMNSDYPAPALQQQIIGLTDSDHAMLSGLADFDASITQAVDTPNPKHLDELDTFSYQASQNTLITDSGRFDRTISQQQQSSLASSYHTSLIPDVPLKLTTDNKSQNYYYTQIDDKADSTTEIEYRKGRLAKALSSQSASQSTHVQKFELGKLTEDTTRPYEASQTQDILAILKPFLENRRERLPLDEYRWQQTLSDVHDQTLLKADPADLHGKTYDRARNVDAASAHA
ncbi:hypothetical protein GCM10011430_11140 [Oxalicibacterium solurbis]|uniref:Lactate dehydrogenase n=2 Tax=Oxalicibacterium solurbis TaxID=69280 RepID=A0A8J3B2X0_9BURK|nr:hypothetical protein GCM10011430_11140 [Oxalicibacterium solurbis]